MTVTFLMPADRLSTRSSVCVELFGSHWADFLEILYLSIFRNCVEKIRVTLKSD